MNKLDEVWQERLRHRDKGFKIIVESKNIIAKGNTDAGITIGNEAFEVFKQADIFWREAIIEEKGNIDIEWKNKGECHLKSGEVFKP